jgi:DNA repair exonuclease SbcCD nuclease subunit
MQGLVHYEGAPTEHLLKVTRQAFVSLINAALEHSVDFLIIAGDLYDGAWPDFSTGLFFNRELERLKGIPVYLIYGNHDAEKKMTKKIPSPQNLFLFRSDEPHSLTVPNLPVTIHGQSFSTPAVTDNLARSYPAPQPGHYNIGMLHTGLEGSANHANYAPCTLNELKSTGYNYWALGHIHIAEVLHEKPHIIFPGCLQGRHIKETGRKGATLVTVDDGFSAITTPLYFDHARWVEIDIPLDDARTYEEAQTAIDRQLNSLISQNEEPLPEIFAVRVVLKGATLCHSEITVKQTEILSYTRELSKTISPPIYIEDVKFKTTPHDNKIALSPLILDILKNEFEIIRNDPLADPVIADYVKEVKKYIPTKLLKMESFPQPEAPFLLEDALQEGYDRLLQELLQEI